MTPSTHPGLLGVCLSGAGPTILALVAKDPVEEGTISTDDSEITLGSLSLTKVGGVHERIGEAIKDIWFRSGGIEVEWMALNVDEEGATCREI
jgi:homoserine kinase